MDRVLNNRGEVSEETAKRVLECAKELGYEPNIAGKALAARKKSYQIGVLMPSINNPFFNDMTVEIKRLAKEYAHYGIKVQLKEMQGYNVEKQLQLIEEMGHLSGLIITPMNEEPIRKKLRQLAECGTAVITLNTDIENSERLCYVGSDYYEGGKMAAGLLKLLCKDGATIGIVNGSAKVQGHMKRVQGFCDELLKECKPYTIKAMCEALDDEDIAFEETMKMLRSYKEIDAIFVVAAGVFGTCQAVQQLHRTPTIITFDEIPSTVELLQKDVIQATITQQASVQSAVAMQRMFDLLVKNKPIKTEQYIVNNQIKIKQSYN